MKLVIHNAGLSCIHVQGYAIKATNFKVKLWFGVEHKV